jgi:PASTA domain
VGGRRLAWRPASALLAVALAATLAATLALCTAAALGPPGARAAELSSIAASPSSIQDGETLAVTGTVFGWPADCEIVIDTNPVPKSSCFVANDALTGILTIPSTYPAGKHLITACASQCPSPADLGKALSSPNTSGARIAATNPGSQFPSTTVNVEPAPAPTTPPPAPQPPTPQRHAVVPPVVGMTLASAVTALRGAHLVAEYGSVPPNAHVSGERPAAGASVKVGSRVPLTLVSWVQVPDLTKLTLRQAVATASPALVVQSQTDKGRVGSQAPVAGGLVQPGTVITVTLIDDATNYVLIAIAGGVTIVVLTAVLAAARAFTRRRRRVAQRWYYDHVRLASRPAFEAGFDDAGGSHLPSVQMAVRDTRLQTCELEEAVVR